MLRGSVSVILQSLVLPEFYLLLLLIRHVILQRVLARAALPVIHTNTRVRGMFAMFYIAIISSILARGVNRQTLVISVPNFSVQSCGVIIVFTLAEARLHVNVTPLCSLLWAGIFTCDTLIHCYTKSCVALFNNTVSPRPPAHPPTSSLAEELYQKVKRLFGEPHQTTEDLKAEVSVGFTYLISVVLNEGLNSFLSAFSDQREALGPREEPR